MLVLMKCLKWTPALSMYIVSLCEMKIANLRGEGLSFLVWGGSIQYAIQQFIPSAWIHCIVKGFVRLQKLTVERS
jgi:hypothetical protein